MPIFLEPGQRYPIVLDSDASKPAETRPTFFAKSQSMRGQQRIADVLDRLTADSEVTTKELFADACTVLGEVLVDWRNMDGIAFDADKLPDILSYQEARELMRKISYNQHVQHEEKKS